jgi:hypothetical protein
VTYGLERWTNRTSQTIVFDRVGLRSPKHLELIGASVTPGLYVVGIWDSWPPGYRSLPPAFRRGWERRQPVAGYRLATGATAGIALGLETTGSARRGSTPGLLLWYHDKSGSYLLRDDLRVALIGACKP